MVLLPPALEPITFLPFVSPVTPSFEHHLLHHHQQCPCHLFPHLPSCSPLAPTRCQMWESPYPQTYPSASTLSNRPWNNSITIHIICPDAFVALHPLWPSQLISVQRSLIHAHLSMLVALYPRLGVEMTYANLSACERLWDITKKEIIWPVWLELSEKETEQQEPRTRDWLFSKPLTQTQELIGWKKFEFSSCYLCTLGRRSWDSGYEL